MEAINMEVHEEGCVEITVVIPETISDQTGRTDTEEIPAQLSAEDLEFLGRIMKPSNKRIRPDNIGEVTKIQKVPLKLREANYEKYYEPKSMAIGPIHHRNPKTAQMGKLKENLAAKFVNASGKSGDDLLREIKNYMDELIIRFDDEVIDSFDADSLARMLFLDGCSVLEFIHSYVHDELDEFDISNGEAVLVQQDLLLLENQIPINILRLLMNQSERKAELVNSIVDFILIMVQVPGDVSNKRFLNNALVESDLDSHPVHLLDLLRSVMLFDGGDERRKKNSLPIFLSFQSLAPKRRNRSDMFRSSPPPLRFPKASFNRFTIPLLGNKRAVINSPNHFSDRIATDCTWQDLKSAGVVLKLSQTGSLRDISFKAPYFARDQIELPPLNLDEAATLRLWNLVAFEMCPDNYDTDGGVSSYLSFLDSLVGDEGDVRDLRSARVLHCRSSDAEVAQTIREIGAQIFDQLGYSRAYTKVTARILKHIENGCSTRCAIWKADFYREHFSSPWTFLALVAAVLILVLTAIQTWFAVNPRSNGCQNLCN